jgi:hypothetical protein
MSIDSQMEREEQDLCDRVNSGEISTTEYNQEMRDLQREYRGMAEEAAQDAYDNEMNNW